MFEVGTDVVKNFGDGVYSGFILDIDENGNGQLLYYIEYEDKDTHGRHESGRICNYDWFV